MPKKYWPCPQPVNKLRIFLGTSWGSIINTFGSSVLLVCARIGNFHQKKKKANLPPQTQSTKPTTTGVEEDSIEGDRMISVLAQERLLGAALGSAVTAVVIFENRRNIYKIISENNAKFGNQSQVKRPIFATKSFEIAHLWNKAVDKTFGTVIESLSSRGW